jgi:hypothetical protein
MSDNGRDANPRLPWTHEQIQQLVPKLEESLRQQEAENPNIRPLPPMAFDECLDLFFRLIDTATNRALTLDEAGFMGQLLHAFQSAVRAETLGYKGRFMVITEKDVQRSIERHESQNGQGGI